MDADALATKLARASPYREVTPFDIDMLDDFICDAHKCHDTLIELGGRPTRKVLEEPAGKTIHEKDEIRIFDSDGEFQGTVPVDENLTLVHWTGEWSRFEKELDRWKEFREHQQAAEPKPLLTIKFDPESTDQRLTEILVRLNDWREFQHYYQLVKVGRGLTLTWSISQKMAKIMRRVAVPKESASSSDVQYELDLCFGDLWGRHHDLEIAQKQLTWIECQVPEILLEACASLEAAIPLQQQLETKLKEQANALDQELKDLEAGSGCSVQPSPESAGLTQRICHWGSEMTRLMGEHFEWRIFLRWRRNQPNFKNSAANDDQMSAGRLPDSNIWMDHLSYRRFQLERSRNWLACWQQLLMKDENLIKTTSIEQGLYILENTISTVRGYVREFEKDVHTAELQVQSAEQKLAELALQQSSPATIQDTQQITKHPQLPPSPPKTVSPESNPGDDRVKDLSSTSPMLHRTRRTTMSSASEANQSIQPSDFPSQNFGPQASHGNTSTKRPVNDNDIQMTEVPDPSYQHAAIREDEEAEPRDGILGSMEDSVMVDVESPVMTSSPLAPRLNSMRKTRSTAKLHQNTSSRILKNTGKKPAKKAKTFTEQQNGALLSAIAENGVSTDFPSLRRSQRLREKAAAPSSESPQQFNAAQPSQSSRQKKPGKQPRSVGPSRPSTQKKRKMLSESVEPFLSSRHKRLRT